MAFEYHTTDGKVTRNEYLERVHNGNNSYIEHMERMAQDCGLAINWALGHRFPTGAVVCPDTIKEHAEKYCDRKRLDLIENPLGGTRNNAN